MEVSPFIKCFEKVGVVPLVYIFIIVTVFPQVSY